MARKDMINSIIGDGSSFKGNFIVKGSFQIDGKFEGELKIDGHLVIGPNGRVKTSTIITESITIAGTLIGNIDARREVVLIETGRVLGNIEAPKIDVGEGALIQGEMTITGGQKKDISKVVEESFTGIAAEENSFNSNSSNTYNTEQISNVAENNPIDNNNLENNTIDNNNSENSFNTDSQNNTSSSIF